MKCPKFLQIDWFLGERLVAEGKEAQTASAPAAPTEAAGGADKPPPTPEGPPSPAAQEQGERRAATVAAGEEERAASGAHAEALLDQPDAGALPPAAPSEDASSADSGAPHADTLHDAEPHDTGANAPGGVATPKGIEELRREFEGKTEAEIAEWRGKLEDSKEDLGIDDETYQKILRDLAPIEQKEREAALAKAQQLLKPEWDKAGIAIGPPTPEEIDRLRAEGKIDFREARALRDILKRTIEEGKTILRMRDDEISAFRERMGIKPKESGWFKGGIWAMLGKAFTKLMEGLGKLAQSIAGLFGGGEQEQEQQTLQTFARSPIGGDKKFVISAAAVGVDLKASEENAPVTTVTAGKIVELDAANGKITIQTGNTKLVYGNLTPASGLSVGQDVAVSGNLGTIKGNTLNFQVIDTNNNQQVNPTQYLANFTQPAEAAPQMPALAAEVAYAPIDLAANEKLAFAKNFEATGNRGIELTAPKGKPIRMMADGMITESSGDHVVVTYANGTIITMRGLKDDSSRVTAKNEIVKAGTIIGTSNDTGVLIIEITENGTAVDPAIRLAKFLPTNINV